MGKQARVLASLAILAAAAAGCGGGGSKVTASSLYPRLLPASAVPGFSLQRRLDWSDPVNLLEGVPTPAVMHPSSVVAEFQGSHFEGAAGEVLQKGAGMNQTEVRIGVAKFKSAGDATKVAKWMHANDLQQPCFSSCQFSPRPAAIAGLPGVRFVIQSGTAPPTPPPGAPKPPAGAPAQTAPANYFAEFTRGPYLYWVGLGADASAKSQVETGIKLYYQRAQRQST